MQNKKKTNRTVTNILFKLLYFTSLFY